MCSKLKIIEMEYIDFLLAPNIINGGCNGMFVLCFLFPWLQTEEAGKQQVDEADGEGRVAEGSIGEKMAREEGRAASE